MEQWVDEVRYVPGAFVEGAFVLEPSKNKSFIQLITLGGQFSFYTKSLPIMADRKAYAYIGELFVRFEFRKDVVVRLK